MLTVFRRIRKGLLASGTTRKYLLYAIGEIALVVIGILIALSINNWNEAQKSLQYEQKTLAEIGLSIKTDSIRWARLISRVEFKEKAINDLLNYIDSSKTISDSIFHSHYYRMGIGVTFSYDNGAYESVKSGRLEKIRNDSLRSSIINIYEVTYPRYEYFINGRKLWERERKTELEDHFLSYSFERGIDQNWKEKPVIDFDELRNNVNFWRIIKMEKRRASEWRDRLETVIPYTNSLIQQIEKIY
jgi:hypothetical protein